MVGHARPPHLPARLGMALRTDLYRADRGRRRPHRRDRDLVRDLLASGAADRWFFLRYADPDVAPACPLPRRARPAARRGAAGTGGSRASALERGIAWRIELGTYEREVERYGGPDGDRARPSAPSRPTATPCSRSCRCSKRATRPGGALADRPVRRPPAARRPRARPGASASRSCAAGRARSRATSAGTRAVRGRIGERFRRERAVLERLLDPVPASRPGSSRASRSWPSARGRSSRSAQELRRLEARAGSRTSRRTSPRASCTCT